MTLRPGRPSAASQRAIDRLAVGRPPHTVVGDAGGAAIETCWRKYTLTVRWKGRRVWFLRPRFIGWQHLARGPHGPVRVTTRRHGRGQRVVSVSDGPFAAAAASALTALRGHPSLRRDPVTVASLSVSALMVQALWLRSARGDRYYILEPSHPLARRGELLTRRQFEASLRRVFRELAGRIRTIDALFGGGVTP